MSLTTTECLNCSDQSCLIAPDSLCGPQGDCNESKLIFQSVDDVEKSLANHSENINKNNNMEPAVHLSNIKQTDIPIYQLSRSEEARLCNEEENAKNDDLFSSENDQEELRSRESMKEFSDAMYLLSNEQEKLQLSLKPSSKSVMITSSTEEQQTKSTSLEYFTSSDHVNQANRIILQDDLQAKNDGDDDGSQMIFRQSVNEPLNEPPMMVPLDNVNVMELDISPSSNEFSNQLEQNAMMLGTKLQEVPQTSEMFTNANGQILNDLDVRNQAISSENIAATAAANDLHNYEDEDREQQTFRNVMAAQDLSNVGVAAVAAQRLSLGPDDEPMPIHDGMPDNTLSSISKQQTAEDTTIHCIRIERSNSCSDAGVNYPQTTTSGQQVQSSLAPNLNDVYCGSSLDRSISSSSSNVVICANESPLETVVVIASVSRNEPARSNNMSAVATNDRIGVEGSSSSSRLKDSKNIDQFVNNNNSSPNQLSKSQSNSANNSNQQSKTVSSSQQQQASAKQQLSSSRFFSSKLNTGSLWSLLSGGGGDQNEEQPSSIVIESSNNDTSSNSKATKPSFDNNNITHAKITSGTLANLQTSFFEKAASFGKRTQQQAGSGDYHWLTDWNDNSNTNNNNTSNNSTSHIRLKREDILLGKTSSSRLQMGSSSSRFSSSSSLNNDSQLINKIRYRFTLKYVGSSMLHKNFTLSMLEWVAKDIRRHTLKAAADQGRHVAFRDINFEIHANKLVASNLKDGSCIFVHPMHYVTKYVQLQLDQNCFAYIIREPRDSIQFVHIFQAKSANKVHEIFNALRETTAQVQTASIQSSSQQQQQQQQQRFATNRFNNEPQTNANDTNLIGNNNQSISNYDSSQQQQAIQHSISKVVSSNDSTIRHDPISNQQQKPAAIEQLPTTTTSNMTESKSMGELTKSSQLARQQSITTPNAGAAPPSTATESGNPALTPSRGTSINIDNSYQFEVMFVKRVKLQCRRVPASFVDDALETLKSFGDSKVAQMKAKTRATIINGTVDERQEYDEACQSPPPASATSASTLSASTSNETFRRGSTPSDKAWPSMKVPNGDDDDRSGSKSCHQTPTKQQADQQSESQRQASTGSGSSSDEQKPESDNLKKHSSMESLNNSARLHHQLNDTTARYSNDFSPYNTITSSGLNQRIAAIPVVSHGSVSLDHETRQRLARQVRQTIQATAANIKKDVYASGSEFSQLKSTHSLKAINSLSCTVASEVPPLEPANEAPSIESADGDSGTNKIDSSTEAARRSSESFIHQTSSPMTNLASNNFDLFRRASARQVVKNRTMLLLIGKEELCTISIDKHQMLFSKSFSQIMHCLQGHNNRDHFGLICRDSNKIQPTAESYAGFIFKCQSEKVVREIMAALKQVIYNSQHNYDGYYSPYNPIHQSIAKSSNTSDHKHGLMKKLSTDLDMEQYEFDKARRQQADSLVQKRGFSKQPLDIDEAAKLVAASTQSKLSTFVDAGNKQDSQQFQQQPTSTAAGAEFSAATGFAATAPIETTSLKIGSPSSTSSQQHPLALVAQMKQPKLNVIKTMFCDNCPLYWYHRLCCDIESLPMDASKAIILRRIDSSMTEREQDDLYSKFSEHKIESIEEHNVIFMSLLRHLCESKQTKHAQTGAHLNALAKNLAILKQQQQAETAASNANNLVGAGGGLTGSQAVSVATGVATPATGITQSQQPINNQHQRATRFHHTRSGSTGGVFFDAALQNADAASAVAIDNLKRAKNTISISIENMLKRRASNPKDDQSDQVFSSSPPITTSFQDQSQRSGSFRVPRSGQTRLKQLDADLERSKTDAENSQDEGGSRRQYDEDTATIGGPLKRSQSSNDSTSGGRANQSTTWRDSFSRTIQESQDQLTNPFVDFFRRKSNYNSNQSGSLRTSASQASQSSDDGLGGGLAGLSISGLNNNSSQTSTENLSVCSSYSSLNTTRKSGLNANNISPKHCNTPNITSSNEAIHQSMLSSVFWKKSLFDKIRQPQPSQSTSKKNSTHVSTEVDNKQLLEIRKKRTSQELRDLWKKAVFEQITLLKMDKQNQRLAGASPCRQKVLYHTKKEEKNDPNDNYSQPNRFSNSVSPQSQQENDTTFCDDPIKLKLNYREIPYSREASTPWDRLLNQDAEKKVEFVEVARLVRLGVPKRRRGEVWMFLMNQYQLRHGINYQPADEFQGDANQPYRGLLTQLSVQQHEIFVDIGRTFPTHPYYSQYLSIGQLSLFNLLKAYSLLDQEVGYCQGLSFVAGILLLHVNTEDEAFELMRHLLFNFGLRRQYLPSMNALHLQLYQMTRLLRDHEYELFNHFDRYDISPTLYAAPWFLTLFASQFPLGFVARLIDLISLIGIEAIFRVSINLLAYHRRTILSCNGIESTMEFLKSELINIKDQDMVKIFDKSFSLDLRNQLLEYEIEYTFYCAEDHRAMTCSKTSNTTSFITDQATSPNDKTGVKSNEGLCEKSKQATLDGGQHEPIQKQGSIESTSKVADATASVIIQHLLSNNHLKSLRINNPY